MKKKAFTLTELLVVVVIIGVLSAVVLPKFNKVIESRRTAEAESVMRAVRNEQEMRCTLDKNYATDAGQLAVWPKHDSENYTYALNKGGMSATRKDKDYTLEIKTYLDGGICCSGSYCANLNKDYPLCDDYEATPNTKNCVPPKVEEESSVEPEPTLPGPCEPTHNGQSTYTEDCPTGQEGSITYTWNVNTCTYEAQEHCSACSPTNEGKSQYNEPCPSPQVGSIFYMWNTTTCEYDEDNQCKDNSCQPKNGRVTYTEPCPSPQVGSGTIYTWDANICDYKKEGPYCGDSDSEESKASCVKIVEVTGAQLSVYDDCGSPNSGAHAFDTLVDAYTSIEFRNNYPVNYGICANLASHMGAKAGARYQTMRDLCPWACVRDQQGTSSWQKRVSVEQISEGCLPSELGLP